MPFRRGKRFCEFTQNFITDLIGLGFAESNNRALRALDCRRQIAAVIDRFGAG